MQYWAYRMSDIPDVDKVISHGDFASMDGVIYTHATDAEVLRLANNASATSEAGKAALASGYAVYGQEISNNYTYGQNNYASGGERYTTLTTKFPASIDVDKVGNIISLNDTEYCRNYGETGSNMRFVNVPVNDSGSTAREGWWCTKNASGIYTAAYATDDAAKAAVEADPTLELYKVYGIEGKVSTFFRYYNDENDGIGVHRNGYPKVGVTLVVAYTDVVTGAEYSEFEFCYVMPNPAWAHTLAATRNLKIDDVVGISTNNYQSSYGIFNRFEGSSGEATDYYSSMLFYSSRGTTNEVGYGHGVSGYLSDFGTSATGKDLSELSYIKTLYNFYDKGTGVNSGSFAAWTHEDKGFNAYTASPDLINVNYYVDYSDKNEYGKLITVNGSGVPTGYQFKMKTNNFLWKNYPDSSIFDVSSYARNTTGLHVTYSSTYDNDPSRWEGPNIDDYKSSNTDVGIYATNYEHFGTDVTFAGKKRWYDDAMLFHTDMRQGSFTGVTVNSTYMYTLDYRNKLLYYFSDGTKRMLKGDSDRKTNYVDDTRYNNGTETRFSVYNYLNNGAYTTASNGKADTNAWEGTATFTGKDTVKQNTIDDLYDRYKNNTTGIVGGIDDHGEKRLYDGYYYYHFTNNFDREDVTYSLDEAQTSSTGDYGRLDVTAENLANYILEMGNYHKISDFACGGGRIVGNETYHYYNIGVATCDKGAARDFLETFALKRLKCEKGTDGKRHVILDDNTGRPTVETRDPSENDGDANFIEDLGDNQGNLYVEDTSAKSYRDYINAVARLSWFVQNPQNTVQDYLKSEDEYNEIDAINNASPYDYTTAYASGTAIYKQGVSNTDIFGDGTTSTDAVQAQLIKDVITAYENLYTVDDYREVEKEYKEIKAEIEADIADANGNYTQESIDNYTNAFNAIAKSVAYFTTETGIDPSDLLNPTDFNNRYNEDFWRYSEYSGADYDTIREAMAILKETLMPKVDTSVLSATAAAKAGDSANPADGTVRYGIYGTVDGNYVQTKRADDWSKLYEKVNEADKTPFNASSDGLVQEKAPDAKYKVTETKYIDEVIGLTERDKEGTEYPYEVYRQTTVPSGTAGTATTYVESGDVYVDLGSGEYAVVSDDQKAINTENHELDAMSIRPVDNASAYQSYNASYKVVDESLEMDKYLPVAQAMINNAKATRYDGLTDGGVDYGPVYYEADSDAVSLYTSVTGKSDFTVGTDLKLTGANETDPITAKLLETASVLELDANKETYVKKFKVSFTVKENDATSSTTSQDVYYGELATFNIPSGAQWNSTFSLTYLAGLYNDIGDATSSAKFSFAGTSFSKVAKSNMAITCKMKKVTADDSLKKVEIRDIYGTVVDVFYASEDSLVADGVATPTITFGTYGSATAGNVPFYSFSSWEKLAYTDKTTEERVYSYTPKYNAGETFTINVDSTATVTGASGSEGVYTTPYDNLVTVDATSVSDFYAWATVDSVENKYQIASYEKAYSFYAIVPETFVIVKKDGDAYKVGNTTLTAANVDSVYDVGFIDGNTALTPDIVLKNKLDKKAPFVSLIAANLSDSKTKANVYCRITTGASTKYGEIGVLATSKEANKAYMVKGTASLFKTSTISELTGQYTYTISRPSKAFTAVTFRGYMSYQMPYVFKENTYMLNVSETSENIIVARA